MPDEYSSQTIVEIMTEAAQLADSVDPVKINQMHHNLYRKIDILARDAYDRAISGVSTEKAEYFRELFIKAQGGD